MTTNRLVRTTASAAVLVLAGCAEGAEARNESSAAAGSVPDAATPAVLAAPHAAAEIRFTVAPSGNVARYRVRERLFGRDRDNDAIGETAQITGTITVDSSGALIPNQSRIVVGTGAFKSDSDRRDGYVSRRLLQADSFPTVTLVPTTVRGLPTRMPAAESALGPITFDLVGNLTVRGVTRPTTWRVTARQAGTTVTGSAETAFTFTDFAIAPPQVRSVLSVADTIRLEYDFTLTRTDAPAR